MCAIPRNSMSCIIAGKTATLQCQFKPDCVVIDIAPVFRVDDVLSTARLYYTVPGDKPSIQPQPNSPRAPARPLIANAVPAGPPSVFGVSTSASSGKVHCLAFTRSPCDAGQRSRQEARARTVVLV